MSDRYEWRVSTTDAERVCHATPTKARGYCGRRSAPIVATWDDTTCADCRAAHRADHPKARR